ncbi:MAG: ABC transporter ATP-binding protein [Pseudomonadales bacterium]|jgi:putative ABC transport system ATP-binding protein|nr:ABC transporter ATP-binding protein [Pseudomonadales bacterium]
MRGDTGEQHEQQALVRVSGLGHAYAQGGQAQAVLRDLSFTLRRGETVALLGRSGCGKTTLLNLISGIEAVQQGEIEIAGIRLTALDEEARTRFRRQHIGFIYQFFNLVPSLTAAENVALILELNGAPLQGAMEHARELLGDIGLGSKADHFAAQLSGGEQQRVAILRAVAHEPALVLADEPTGNLDAHSGQDMLQVLRQRLRAHGSTTLLVTHSLAVAQSADRILTLDEGGIHEHAGDFAW